MDIVIFGTGEMAEVAWHYLTHEGGHRVVAFTVERAYITQSERFGIPVVPYEEARTYRHGSLRMYVAVSFKHVNADREAVCKRALADGYSLIGYLSPNVIELPDDFTPAPNTLIMSANLIQPFATIGWNTTIWNGNHIGHHTTIGDHCFIASHAVISGHVRIGDNTFIGVNATIRDNVTIGKRCVIGAGALVLHDVPDDSVVLGPESPVVPRRSTVA